MTRVWLVLMCLLFLNISLGYSCSEGFRPNLCELLGLLLATYMVREGLACCSSGKDEQVSHLYISKRLGLTECPNAMWQIAAGCLLDAR